MFSPGWVAVAAMIAALLLWMSQEIRRERRLRVAEATLREELHAYARMDVAAIAGGTATPAQAREQARRMCAVVAERSAFQGAALLVRDAEQKLRCEASAGMDDLVLRALEAWGGRFQRGAGSGEPERNDAGSGASGSGSPASYRLQRKHYRITLGPLEAFDLTRTSGPLGVCRMMVFPLWTSHGVMLGALVTCRDRREPADVAEQNALPPLEGLAAQLARALENAALSDRLLRAEKMAGLGHLARGVAHELNNPLTAVLGYAELIVEGVEDARLRQDALSIVEQAGRMKDTVESLLHFWRPVAQTDAAVDVPALLQTAVARMRKKLDVHGIGLDVQIDVGRAEAGACAVRGSAESLAEVFEHLLNNAAQAVAAWKPEDRGTPRAVRLTLAHEAKSLQVVISDTGAGFAEPARVFDPFYTTRQPGDGHGMGLTLSYGIVRQHGGEISALNLHPHGAAVVVELPLARVLEEDLMVA